ncbi:MAG: hypothetical protein AAGD13_18165 [Pseudomonadota bacterium]
MTDATQHNPEFDLDGALETLAREAEQGSPRPGPDLVARVLADAAAQAPRVDEVPAAGGSVRSHRAPGIFETLFGWTSGAVAAMALSLAIGVGLGMELDPGDLPMTERPVTEQFEMADGSLFNEDFL